MVEINDDKAFAAAMEAEIKKMGEFVRKQPAKRQNQIIARLEEEMAGLKTNVARLLYEEGDPRRLNCQKAYDKALSIFGDSDNAMLWLTSPCYALGGHVPMQYLNTPEGTETVMDILGQIEYGVCS